MVRSVLTLTLLALVMAGTAKASDRGWLAPNYLRVFDLGGGVFEVVNTNSEGPRGMWCAAAAFAERKLGHPPTKRLYILRPLGPAQSDPRRKGVVFTTSEALLPTAPSRGVSLSLRKVGYSLPSFHAREFCWDVYDDREIWVPD